MKLYLLYSICFVFVYGLAADEKVELGVYYETLCPDSIRFINEQLYPTFKKLGNLMSITLYPFGKADYSVQPNSTKTTFRCQHGPRECTGNIIQACALNYYPSMSQALPFINCMEEKFRPEEAGEECAKSYSLNYTLIDTCANGDLGSSLLVKMGEATKSLNPKMVFVPWLTVGGLHNDQIQRGITNLKKLICQEYKGIKPQACSEQ